MKVEVIQADEKKILILDYRETKSDEDMIQVVDEAAEIVTDPEIVLTISDVRGVRFGQKSTQYVKEIVKNHFSRHTKKNAIIGIAPGAQQMILTGFNQFSRSKRAMVNFDTREEAIQYLIED